MAVTCKNCGGQHPVWECRKPAKKSTAALKEVHTNGDSKVTGDMPRYSGEMGDDGRGSLSKTGAEIGALRNETSQAGTQAPPVDARKHDRHAPGYMAAYMRKRRAAPRAPDADDPASR